MYVCVCVYDSVCVYVYVYVYAHWPTPCRNVKYSCGFSASVPGQLRHPAERLTAVSWTMKEKPEKGYF